MPVASLRRSSFEIVYHNHLSFVVDVIHNTRKQHAHLATVRWHTQQQSARRETSSTCEQTKLPTLLTMREGAHVRAHTRTHRLDSPSQQQSRRRRSTK